MGARKDPKQKVVSSRGRKQPFEARASRAIVKSEVQGSKGGRPSSFKQSTLDAICARLSKGEPLAAICRDDGMPHDSTVRDWAAAKEEVSLAIARARESGEDWLAAECLEIADEAPALDPKSGSIDNGDIQHKRLRIDTRLKLLAKWNPKKYGEKLDVTTGGDKMQGTIVERVVIDPKN